jgi:hypothetical protein
MLDCKGDRKGKERGGKEWIRKVDRKGEQRNCVNKKQNKNEDSQLITPQLSYPILLTSHS